MFARIVFDRMTETWLRAHVEALEELGGVVEVVVPDNLKAAVVRAAFGIDGGTAPNRSYRDLARHCGFEVAASLRAVPGVRDVHHVHVWSVSTRLRAASAHLVVPDSALSTAAGLVRLAQERLHDQTLWR